MPNKFKVFLFVLLFFLISTPVTAELLMPMQVGQILEFTRTDSLNNSWNVEVTILNKEIRDSKTYFHARQWNYRNDGELEDWYFRSTDDALYFWGADGENALIRSGTVGETWTVGDEVTTIMESESVTVPFGGPYTAIVNRKNKVGSNAYWYEYVVPGLGFVKEVDYNTANAPKVNELIRIRYNKALPWIPLLLLDDKLLTGTWNFYFTETGGEQEGPHEIGIDQKGNSMFLCDYERLYNGIINGNEVSIDVGWAQLIGTIKNNLLIQGTYLGGTWRMEKQSDTSFCSELSFWDVDANGIPKFVASGHIELNKIEQISKFRSGEGHDYSDDFESCRNMKHYYRPYGQLDWSQIKIFSPIDGTIIRIELESFPNSGKQVWIRSTAYPAFTFRIFHVNLNEMLSVGGSVSAGQQIGTHISNISYNDIAVGIATPDGWKLVSFFSVMTDTLFQAYQNRGVPNRDNFIISKEARDSDPLNCTGETFGTPGTIENWVTF